MEFLDIPLFDDDFFKMMFRFVLNFIFLTVIIRFIYYLLEAYKEGIASIASGATFPEVSGSKLKQYKINLPTLPIQQKIAKILSNYDDLIENNFKRIKLLEESARLTYEEWFLRFRIDGKKLDINPSIDLPFGWEKKSVTECVAFKQDKRKIKKFEGSLI